MVIFHVKNVLAYNFVIFLVGLLELIYHCKLLLQIDKPIETFWHAFVTHHVHIVLVSYRSELSFKQERIQILYNKRITIYHILNISMVIFVQMATRNISNMQY